MRRAEEGVATDALDPSRLSGCPAECRRRSWCLGRRLSPVVQGSCSQLNIVTLTSVIFIRWSSEVIESACRGLCYTAHGRLFQMGTDHCCHPHPSPRLSLGAGSYPNMWEGAKEDCAQHLLSAIEIQSLRYQIDARVSRQRRARTIPGPLHQAPAGHGRLPLSGTPCPRIILPSISSGEMPVISTNAVSQVSEEFLLDLLGPTLRDCGRPCSMGRRCRIRCCRPPGYSTNSQCTKVRGAPVLPQWMSVNAFATACPLFELY